MGDSDISHISFGLIKHANARASCKPIKLFKTDIVWRNVIIFIILHWLSVIAAIYLWNERRIGVFFSGKLITITHNNRESMQLF